MAVLFVDFDHFKSINDTHGHHFWNTVLQRSIQTIHNTFGTTDIIGRYGGEEFVIALVECTAEDAYTTAERIRRNIAGNVIQKRLTGVFVPVTVSIGLHMPTPRQRRVTTILRYADRALYDAKGTGRNRICVYDPKTMK